LTLIDLVITNYFHKQ